MKFSAQFSLLWYSVLCTLAALVSLYSHACVLGLFSRVRLFVMLWVVAHQPPLSMGFSRQEYWSGLPHPPPGDLTHSGIEPASPKPPALAGLFVIISAAWEARPRPPIPPHLYSQFSPEQGDLGFFSPGFSLSMPEGSL